MKKRTKYNEDILSILKERYGFSFDYIRKSLTGDRVGHFPELMKNEYELLAKASKKAIQNELEKLKQ